MPLPTKNPGEKEKEFISRCMGSEVLLKDFPDQKQRAAVCYSQYKKHKKVKGEEVEWCNCEGKIEEEINMSKNIFEVEYKAVAAHLEICDNAACKKTIGTNYNRSPGTVSVSIPKSEPSESDEYPSYASKVFCCAGCLRDHMVANYPIKKK